MKRQFLGAFLLGTTVLASYSARGSSHREAPGLRNDPAVDVTDVYAFKSPDDAAAFTLVMNVSPGYIPQAGPNWYAFDDNALYEIHVDKNGDAVEDITYQFRFTTSSAATTSTDVLAFLPPVEFKNGAYSGSLQQTYSFRTISGDRRKGAQTIVKTNIPVAPTRIGPGTTDGGRANIDNVTAMYGAYKTLADNAITSVSGYKVFAGPRADPFYVDLGGVFDSLYVRLNPLGVASGDPRDSLSGINVLSIVLNVPRTELGTNFGVWATTSRPQGTVRRTGGAASVPGGGFVQVSRLGNPLVNEIVIGLKDKDKFNATHPKDDVTNFASYVTKPQLAALLNALYGKANGAIAKLLEPVVENDRADLVAAFVTGIDGVNKIPDATGTGDMIRVNTGLPDALQKWPASGRQLSDDVVKAALTFLANCAILPTVTTTEKPSGIDNPAGSTFALHASSSVNCVLDDAVTAANKTATPGGSGPYLTAFPYMDLPFSAYGKASAGL